MVDPFFRDILFPCKNPLRRAFLRGFLFFLFFHKKVHKTAFKSLTYFSIFFIMIIVKVYFN